MYCIRPDPLRASKRVWLRKTTQRLASLVPGRIALTRGKIRLVTLGNEVGAGCELRSGM